MFSLHITIHLCENNIYNLTFENQKEIKKKRTLRNEVYLGIFHSCNGNLHTHAHTYIYIYE